MISLNTNLNAITAARNLQQNSVGLGASIEKLSSGQRINSAKDDAAGMAVAEGMTSRIRGLQVAERNAADLIGMLEATDSVLSQVTGNVQRIRELAVQSANGTLGDDQRAFLQQEVDELTEENGRLLWLNYGDLMLIPHGASQTVSIQIGPDQGDTFVYPHITKDIHSRSQIDISTQAAAEAVIDPNGSWGGSVFANDSLKGDFESLSTMRSQVGAIMNRMDSVISSIRAEREQTLAARARITDTDYAAETASMARSQVLQQAGTAMLAQANSHPQTVLKLLQ